MDRFHCTLNSVNNHKSIPIRYHIRNHEGNNQVVLHLLPPQPHHHTVDLNYIKTWMLIRESFFYHSLVYVSTNNDFLWPRYIMIIYRLDTRSGTLPLSSIKHFGTYLQSYENTRTLSWIEKFSQYIWRGNKQKSTRLYLIVIPDIPLDYLIDALQVQTTSHQNPATKKSLKISCLASVVSERNIESSGEGNYESFYLEEEYIKFYLYRYPNNTGQGCL